MEGEPTYEWRRLLPCSPYFRAYIHRRLFFKFEFSRPKFCRPLDCVVISRVKSGQTTIQLHRKAWCDTEMLTGSQPWEHASESIWCHLVVQWHHTVQKRFGRDCCCRGRSEPGCQIVGANLWVGGCWPPEPTTSPLPKNVSGQLVLAWARTHTREWLQTPFSNHQSRARETPDERGTVFTATSSQPAAGEDAFSAAEKCWSCKVRIACLRTHTYTLRWWRGLVFRTSVFGWWTFPDLHLIYGWHLTTFSSLVNQPGKFSLPSLQGR